MNSPKTPNNLTHKGSGWRAVQKQISSQSKIEPRMTHISSEVIELSGFLEFAAYHQYNLIQCIAVHMKDLTLEKVLDIQKDFFINNSLYSKQKTRREPSNPFEGPLERPTQTRD